MHTIQCYMNDIKATRIIFLIMGLITAVWAVIVPFAKMNTGVNDGVLGFLLLCLGAGAIVAMPLAGSLSSKYGCQKIMVVSTIMMLIVAPFLSFVSSIVLLGVFLALFGICIGMNDCAMNVQAIIIEKREKKPLMSGFHGMYSAGGIVGAGLMTGLLALKLNIVISTFLVLIFIIILFIISYKHFLPYANPAEGAAFAMPKGVVLVFGIICFVVFLIEGTALDWSAVYLVDVKKISDTFGGLGFAVFAAAMTIGRLSGDYIINKLGALPIVILGAITTLVGFVFIINGNMLYMILLGYFFIGGGCSNIVPVMFNQIGRQNTMPQMVAVPAVTTLGYFGILAGPAGIGFIAHHSSLPHAFVFVALLMVIVLILAIFLKKNLEASH